MNKCFFVLLTLILSGCMVEVIPQPTEYGVINSDSSQTITKDNISITAKVEEPDTLYDLAELVTPVSITIENRKSSELSFPQESFLLIDDQGRQYSPISPDDVRKIISQNRYYILPYPYVGFYYLEDYEKVSFYNQFNSQLPYFYEVYPQDIYTKALPMTAIIPKGKISGLIFFNTDIRRNKSGEVLVYPPDISKGKKTDFKFPFVVK